MGWLKEAGEAVIAIIGASPRAHAPAHVEQPEPTAKERLVKARADRLAAEEAFFAWRCRVNIAWREEVRASRDVLMEELDTEKGEECQE